jgi:hypothetical protein
MTLLTPMNRTFFSAVVAISLFWLLDSPVCAQSNNSLTPQEVSEGWKLLFDGTSMDHWRVYNGDSMPEGWTIQDDAMTFRPEESNRAESGKNIITKKKYKNFHLKLEWKIKEEGNSGIFYGVLEQPDEAIYWSAPEVQIVDNSVYPDTMDARDRMAGSLYDLVPAEPQNVNPPGQWNSVQVIVDGSHVEHWQNGTKVLSFDRWDRTWYEMIRNSKFDCHNEFGNIRKGRIGIQDHGAFVKIRNIKIKTID